MRKNINCQTEAGEEVKEKLSADCARIRDSRPYKVDAAALYFFAFGMFLLIVVAVNGVLAIWQKILG